MCNDCVREIAVAMNFRRKAIEANNIILSTSVSVVTMVKPEIDDFPSVVTTFDFPSRGDNTEDVKHVAKIESQSSSDHEEKEPVCRTPERVRVKKSMKKERALEVVKVGNAELKKRRVRGPYKRKPKEEQ